MAQPRVAYVRLINKYGLVLFTDTLLYNSIDGVVDRNIIGEREDGTEVAISPGVDITVVIQVPPEELDESGEVVGADL